MIVYNLLYCMLKVLPPCLWYRRSNWCVAWKRKDSWIFKEQNKMKINWEKSNYLKMMKILQNRMHSQHLINSKCSCYYCGKPGHLQRDCYQPNGQQRHGSNNQDQSQGGGGYRKKRSYWGSETLYYISQEKDSKNCLNSFVAQINRKQCSIKN